MRIALVVEYFDRLSGGAGQWTLAFAKYLLEHRHTVLVVTFQEGQHTLPVQTHVLPNSPYALERARRIAKCITELAPAVVYDAGAGWSGNVLHPHAGSIFLSHQRFIATLSKRRRLCTSVSPRGWFFRWNMVRLETEQANRADRIVAVSHLVRDLLVQRHNLPSHRIIVIPNGVDNDRFNPAQRVELREPARRSFGLGDAVLFLIVAQNMLLKGVDNAMKALSTLVNEGAAVRLAVVGAEPDAFWTKRATELGVVDHVDFLGYVDDMVPVYAAADVVVHPTRWDACSLATLEGMAAGLPVITTTMNGAAELISHGRNGLLVGNPEDTGALAAQMRLLLDPQERSRIGGAARETAIRYDARDNYRAVETVLLEVAAATARHGN